MRRIHFVGIGGSGMSGVGMIAQFQGYEISGCDLNINTPYINKLKKAGVKVFEGQSEEHVEGADIVAVTPAVYFQNSNHPEIILAKKENKIITWQKFLGKYLLSDKKTICIAGTHGKSTTTAMTALLFEKMGFDPSVMIGANVKEWDANFRVGKDDIFIVEADEFFDNFLNYKPDVIILNNIEFDHPDYFENESQVFESFRKFINNLKGDKILIYNKDDWGIKKLFRLIGKRKLEELKLFGYTTQGKGMTLNKNETKFEVDSVHFSLRTPGKYNVRNALGVITLGKIFKIPVNKIKNSLREFEGIGRRLELIGEKNSVKVYDDYAHHPTAIKVTLAALRQRCPEERILVVVEPHTFSRTRALLPLYKNVFKDADRVIIAPIFKSRDTKDFGVSGESIVEVSNHKAIEYIDNFSGIVAFVKETKKSYDVIIVMGAGDSYKLARDILASL